VALTLSFEDVGKAGSGFQFEQYFSTALEAEEIELVESTQVCHF